MTEAMDESYIALRDGARVAVRALRPDDRERLLELFAGLSERSRFQRFGQYLPDLPPALLNQLLHVDGKLNAALAALDAGGRIIAVGRYAPGEQASSAEFALTVADAWQAKGLGRALLERLCVAAREAGYESLYGQIQDANREMLDLAARLGFAQVGRSVNEVKVERRLP
jgi:acetyltransferase